MDRGSCCWASLYMAANSIPDQRFVCKVMRHPVAKVGDTLSPASQTYPRGEGHKKGKRYKEKTDSSIGGPGAPQEGVRRRAKGFGDTTKERPQEYRTEQTITL